MPPYRVLSLDGGGILGVITATLLERLEAALPGFLARVDLFAGTSTGGILALGLASGLTPARCSELYELRGREVFPRPLLPGFAAQFVRAKYPNAPLKRALEEQFGDQTLGDLPKKVLIASFDLDTGPESAPQLRTWKPKFFHNYPSFKSDAHERVVDVALRTSAAPTFFPIYQHYTDGGVVANNPGMCAVAQAVNQDTGGQKLEDVALLSLGTGGNPAYVAARDAPWGIQQWARPLVNLVLTAGAVGLVDYQCRQILGNRYHRLNPPLPEPFTLDDVAEVPRLKAIALQADLTTTLAWLKPAPDPHFRDVTFPGWFQ
jgi:patatin-like phospholipase/acyl hydrolase